MTVKIIISRVLAVSLLYGIVGLCSTSRAEDYFAQFPDNATPQWVGHKIAQRLIESPHRLWIEHGTLHYAEVATWYGALNFAELTKDSALSQQLTARFKPFFGTEEKLVPPVTHVDHSVFGVLPLELYRQTGLVKYRVMGLGFADGQWDKPNADGLSNQTRYWIDDMYMITVLQVQAWRATHDMQYLDHAANEMVAYLKRLQQPNGLFFHAPDAPFHWGRGNGWVAAGMTELLRALPEQHPQRAQILSSYRLMMSALKKYQSSSGMWRQVIDHDESWVESSSTGMFAYAVITGVKNKWLDNEVYGPVARKAWLALSAYVDDTGAVREVCAGTGTNNELAYYMNRPRIVGDFHGQAAVMWSAAALLRPVGE